MFVPKSPKIKVTPNITCYTVSVSIEEHSSSDSNPLLFCVHSMFLSVSIV